MQCGLMKATPVASEIMTKMGDYLSLCNFDLNIFNKDLILPYERKSKSDAVLNLARDATLAHIEKNTPFNSKPYEISFREASNGLLAHERKSINYKADFNSGDILKTSEDAELSIDGRYVINKTATATTYSREGVMTKTESRSYSRQGSFLSRIEKGEFIPKIGERLLPREHTVKYRDERCPFVMHEINGSVEKISLIRLDNLNSLDVQTEAATRLMYANLLYERLGAEEYEKYESMEAERIKNNDGRDISDTEKIEILASMLGGEMPASLTTTFSSVEEAIEYVSRPDIKKAIEVMLDNQHYDMQPNAQPFLRDSVDEKGHGNMYKKAFVQYLSRTKEMSSVRMSSESALTGRRSDFREFDD